MPSEPPLPDAPPLPAEPPLVSDETLAANRRRLEHAEDVLRRLRGLVDHSHSLMEQSQNVVAATRRRRAIVERLTGLGR